jgi:hypothetical protein
VLRSFFAYDPSFLGGTFVASTQAPGASVAKGTFTIDAAGAMPVTVACPRAARSSCAGTVSIYLGAVSGRLKLRAAAAKRTSKPVLLGRTRFKVAPRHRARVRVHLAKRRLKKLAGRRRKGAIVVRAHDAGANTKTTVIPVTLGARPRR